MICALAKWHSENVCEFQCNMVYVCIQDTVRDAEARFQIMKLAIWNGIHSFSEIFRWLMDLDMDREIDRMEKLSISIHTTHPSKCKKAQHKHSRLTVSWVYYRRILFDSPSFVIMMETVASVCFTWYNVNAQHSNLTSQLTFNMRY